MLRAMKIDPPLKPNGAILSYHLTLQGTHANRTFVTSGNHIVLEELSPFTLYSFLAAARTMKGLGPSSILFFYTDESGKPKTMLLPVISLFCLRSLFLRNSLNNEDH